MKRLSTEDDLSPRERYLEFYSDVPTPGRKKQRKKLSFEECEPRRLSFVDADVATIQQSVNKFITAVERLEPMQNSREQIKNKAVVEDVAGTSRDKFKGKGIAEEENSEPNSETDGSDDSDSSYSSDSSLESDSSEEEQIQGEEEQFEVDPADVFQEDSDVEDLFPLKQDDEREVVAISKGKPKKPKKEYAMKTRAAKERVRRFQEQQARVTAQEQFLSDTDSDDCKEPQFPSDDDGGETDTLSLPLKRKSRAKKEGQRVWYAEEKPLTHEQFAQFLCFKDVHQFRRALKNYHIKNRRDYQYLRNDKDRVMVCYKSVGPCPFYMVSSKIAGEDTHCLRVCVEPHTCGITQESSRINSAWLAKVFEENVRSDPDYKVQSMIDSSMRKYGVKISKQMAYRARARAKEIVLGNHKQQYKRIRDYLQTVIIKNPGRRALVTTIPNPGPQANPRFHGLFYMLNAQKEGFLNGWRPFIGVDGCFVKLTTGAQLLTASGRDGNNNLFPLAFGVVGKEDIASWYWFLEQLKYGLGGEEGKFGKWTFMSDRQKGLLTAIDRVFPNCEQRYCLRHIYANFKVAGFRGGDLKSHMDAAAYAYNKEFFDAAMDRMKEDCEEAWEWLSKIKPKHWARHAMDINCKTDLVVNNLSEVFNNFIIGVRDKRIVTMIDGIRTKLMARFEAKRVGIKKAEWEITPTYAEKLEWEKKNSNHCRPVCAAKGLWQITSGVRTHAVYLENRTCGCRKWDVTGLPCKHAVCAIYKSKGHPEDYVSDFFKKPLYIQTHNEVVYPVPGQHDWVRTPEEDIDPPLFLVHPGRRKKNKRKGQDEKDEPRGKGRMTSMRCSNCKKHGQRYTSCAVPLKPHLAIRKAKHRTTRRAPIEGEASTTAATAPPTGVAPADPAPAAKRGTSRRADSAPAAVPPVDAPAVAGAGAKFRPPRPKSTAPTTSAPATAAPSKAATSSRPARHNAGKMPSRFNEAAEVGQRSKRKMTPVRGRGKGRAKRSRIMEYFSCSRGQNAD